MTQMPDEIKVVTQAAFHPARRSLILGASGSGLSRLGESLYRGKDDATMITQDAISHITFLRETVIEEIAFGLEQRGVDPASMQQRVGAVMQALELEDLAENHPTALSGGQTKRVAIACVAVLGAKLVIADDPFAGLDTHSRGLLAAYFDSYPGTVVILAHERPSELSESFQCFELNAQGLIPRRTWSPAKVRVPSPVTPPQLDHQAEVIDLGVSSGTRGHKRSRWWNLRAQETPGFSTQPVHLRLRKGAVVWLKGENGAGKTTLLRTLAGLGPRRDMSYSVSLQTQRAVDQVVCSSVRLFLPDAAWRDRLGIDPDAHPLDLPQSKLRLAQVAAVVGQRRDIVALDEPDVGVDRADRVYLHQMIADALQAGQAVIMTCHDEQIMAEVSQYAEVSEAVLDNPTSTA